MKAYLLAAGEGRRLRPLTDTIPKCLVPIGGTPLLGIWIRLLEAHGVTAVLVNLHHFHERVREFLAAFPTTMTVEQVYEPRLVGSAGTVLTNRGFVDGEKRFLVVYADVLSAIDVGKMVRFHDTRSELLTVGVAPTDRPREKGTVVVDDKGRILAFEEKAEQPRSNLANVGVYVSSPAVFDYMPPAVPAGAVLDFGYDVLPRMVPDVAAYLVNEFLMDIGTPDAYARAQELWPGLPEPKSPPA